MLHRRSVGFRPRLRRTGRSASAEEAERFIVELYDEHARALLGWFQSRTMSAEVAADLCAETFATAIEHRDRFDPLRGDGGAWLWGIARNLLRGFQRSASVERRASVRLAMRTPLVSDDELDLADERCDAAAMADRLDHSLGTLSEAVADAVRARVVDGRSYEDVARRCGCSEVAARARVSRGLSQLLDAVERPAGEPTP